MPGLHLEYGPSAESSTWEELYLIYDMVMVELLEELGFFQGDRPAWHIHKTERIENYVTDLISMLGNAVGAQPFAINLPSLLGKTR